MLVGEIEAAIDSAEAARRSAEESGHFHTRIAAEVNLSHMFERRAEFGHAKRHIDSEHFGLLATIGILLGQ